MQKREERPKSKELEELGSEGAADGVGRSKYYIWVRSSEGVTDYEQGPLEGIEGG